MQKYERFHGEIQKGKHVDEILREYFPDYSVKGVFMDIGAYEPVNISNSYHFEMNGWNTYCFEANTFLIPSLQLQRRNVLNYALSDENLDSVEFTVARGIYGGGSGMAGISSIQPSEEMIEKFGNGIYEYIKISVPQKTLNSVLENELSDVREIDIVSIDVEGWELNVLKGFDLEKYKPKVMVVENIFKNEELSGYILSKGYILDKRIEYNEYYILPKKCITFYGQHDEDKYMNSFFNYGYTGVCVEVGAYDGRSLSNTYHFEQNGWKCLCIEPISESYEKCKMIRENCVNCCISEDDNVEKEFTIFNIQNNNECAISSLQPDIRLISSHKHLINNVRRVNVISRRLSSLLDELNFPTEIDFISIDTENTELDVLKSIDFSKYNIRFFIVENNYNEPFCENFLVNFGYRKINRIAVNDFYAKVE